MRNRRDKGREAGGKEGGERRRKGKRKGSKGKPTKKPIANDIISGRKLQTFLLKKKKKNQGCSLFTLFFNIVL